MKRIAVFFILINFSTLAVAVNTTSHLLDLFIVAGIETHEVCFNNDGIIASLSECNGYQYLLDEGYLKINESLQWAGGNDSGINGCGTSTVYPVSSATCPFTTTGFADCIENQWVLVQTTKSGHFWAVRDAASCTGPTNNLYIWPCLFTDRFSPESGCLATGDMDSVSVGPGYLKFKTYKFGNTPPADHCTDEEHEGRFAVNSHTNTLFVCMRYGWKEFEPTN